MPMVENGHKVRISLSPEHGTAVYIDGTRVEQLVCVEVRHHVGEVARVRLELLPSGIEIVGNAGEVQRAECAPDDALKVAVDQAARLFLDSVKKDAATEGQ